MTNEYNTEGFVTRRGVVRADEVETVKQQLDGLADSSDTRDETLDVREGVVFQVYDVPNRDPPLGRLGVDRRITGAVAELMDDEPAVAWALVLNKGTSDATNWAVPWHQDTSVYCTSIPTGAIGERRGGFATYRPRDDLMSRLVAARIAIDGDSLESGCLRVVRGSHKLGNVRGREDLSARYADEDGEPVELAPGDVLFFNPLLVHRADRSRSDQQRRVVHVYFRPATLALPRETGWIDWASGAR